MEELIQKMRETLGTAFVLYATTHGYHWNVEGSDFYELHKMLEKQYEDIWESLDDIAEKIRQLDAYTPQSLTRFVELSRIEEGPPAPIAARDMLLHLMQSQEIMIDLLTETFAVASKANQQGIANFLGERLEAHQKHRWMLRASAKLRQ